MEEKHPVLLSVGNIRILGRMWEIFSHMALEFCALEAAVSDSKCHVGTSCYVCSIGRVDRPEKYTALFYFILSAEFVLHFDKECAT